MLRRYGLKMKLIRKFRYNFGYWWKDVWERAIGMKLALWLNERHPEWCWAELCLALGLGWDIPNWRDRSENASSCRQDCEQMGACWCGKFTAPDHEARWQKYLDERKAARLVEEIRTQQNEL